jgi:hypothetical protein
VQRALGLLLALAGLAAAGCDPGYGFRGRVREPGACTEGADTPAPVAGATVELRCPDRAEPYLSAESAPDGTFAARKLGTLPAGCTVEVKKRGFAPRTYAVADLCGVSIDAGDHCASISVDPLLSAAAPR